MAATTHHQEFVRERERCINQEIKRSPIEASNVVACELFPFEGGLLGSVRWFSILATAFPSLVCCCWSSSCVGLWASTHS
eukprot:scaffold195436_cov27-Attheya_sp.AAC.1